MQNEFRSLGKQKGYEESTMPLTTDTARLAMLARVERGEFDHSAAAKELGLTPGVWGLWRVRHAKGQGKKAVAKKRAKASGRGRKADPDETARRVAMLGRAQAGELNNAGAAKALGIKLGAWGVWKSNYQKRTGGGAKPAARRGRPPGAARQGRPPGMTAAHSSPTVGLAGIVAQLEGLRRFGEELKAQVRALIEMVEGRFPG
ncbi:MAG: hypothetical protein IPN34_14550 [Planctomycetes bacterium]|nr:hypothetical protein [Planctomycetota bacterium]